MSLPVKKNDHGLTFSVTIQPRASRNEIAGVHDGALKIKLTSPPVEGAANKACLKLLGKTLGVAPSKLSIVSGTTSRNKVIQVDGMDEARFREKLEPHLT
ncbi:DUF167 domain-containing protein [Nitrospina gracilis]|uniref:DUF167 domain-containing protein n=1 Tax=Nitrospina gracilis TaxID=35801 RepID=UPI001F38CEFC|nr:DUF167 domain-containing protein [Nitrospina gracilis]MCF8720058.1 uncharacterized protein (TIGR00251 family) [Nitrospina gracilis Nb-211]